MGLLVLNRTPGESVMIGDDITVTVFGLDGRRVALSTRYVLAEGIWTNLTWHDERDAFSITDAIQGCICSVSGNQVRLGIDAPRSVSVHRQEVYNRIHAAATGETHG